MAAAYQGCGETSKAAIQNQAALDLSSVRDTLRYYVLHGLPYADVLRFERHLLAFKFQNQRAIFRPEWQPLCFGDGDISGIRPSSMSATIVVGFKPGRFNRIPFLRARHSSVNRMELLSTGTTLAAGREFLVMMVSLPVPASRMISQNCCFASAMLVLIWKWSYTMPIISSKE
jgi:hypothetical protein